MLGSTADFLAGLDAIGLRPEPNVPRGVCPECRRELCCCEGQAACDRRRLFNAKRLGRCRQCGEPSRPGRVTCATCAEKMAERARRRRAAYKATGRCLRCRNRAEPGRTVCRWCRKAEARRARENRARGHAGGGDKLLPDEPVC